MCVAGRNGLVKRRQWARFYTCSWSLNDRRCRGYAQGAAESTGLELWEGEEGLIPLILPQAADGRHGNSTIQRGCVERELLLTGMPTVWGQADTEGLLPDFPLTVASGFWSDLCGSICFHVSILHPSKDCSTPVVPKVVKEDFHEPEWMEEGKKCRGEGTKV